MFALKYKTDRQKYLSQRVYDLALMMVERMIDYGKYDSINDEDEVMLFLREKLDGDFDEIMEDIPDKETV